MMTRIHRRCVIFAILWQMISKMVISLKMIQLEFFVFNPPYPPELSIDPKSPAYYCDFIPSQDQVLCNNFITKNKEFKFSTKLFKETYPNSIDFDENDLEIEIGEFLWKKEKLKFKAVDIDGKREITLDQKSWYGLYARYFNEKYSENSVREVEVNHFHSYFEDKGVMKDVALCSYTPVDGHDEFFCKMPWMQVVRYTADEFFEVFQTPERRNRNWKPRHYCEGQYYHNYVNIFLGPDFKVWKCWNGFAWPFDSKISKPVKLDDIPYKDDVNKILKNQPSNRNIFQCEYLEDESDNIGSPVFRCDEETPFRKPFWPNYLEKKFDWKWHNEMNQVVHPPGVDTVRYAILDRNQDVQFKTQDQLNELKRLQKEEGDI